MFYIKSLVAFLRNFYLKKYVIGQVVRRDFKNKYLGSYLGLPWAFIQPAITILVIWVAFTYGLKMGKTTDGFYFLPWLLCGMIPWFFISDTLTAATGSLVEYSYLIRNTSFNVNIIPLVKMFTALIIQVFFLAVIAIFMISYGYTPSIYWIQIIYYLFAAMVLLTGLGWLLAAINVFVRDVGQVVMAGLAILFWATPIIWSSSSLIGNWKYLAYLNPFFYITEGYRYTFLHKTWFFENIHGTIYFWAVTLFIFILGATVFKKLAPHFADTL